MKHQRLALLLCVVGVSTRAQSTGTFTTTGSMDVARSGHTATLLNNGKVLIAGGFNNGALTSAELYDPLTGLFTRTGDMTKGRYQHSATLLPDGRILIAGGVTDSEDPSTYGASAEIYDPSTGTFAATGNPVAALALSNPEGLLLANGKVLLKSWGYNVRIWQQTGQEQVVSLQIYDPVSGAFADAGLSASFGYVNTCTLLSDGRVLMTGQSAGYFVASLYDPTTGVFSPTDPGSDGLETATLLMDGNVLFTGADDNGAPSNEAKLYTTSTGAFSQVGPAVDAWRGPVPAILLPDGTVLVTGGDLSDDLLPFGALASAELYNPASGLFSLVGYMTAARESHTATLLADGTVLIAGGISSAELAVASAEIYQPPVLTPPPVLYTLPDGKQGAVLHAANQELVSPDNPAVAGEALEIYGAGLVEGSVIPPQVSVGGRFADVLFFGDAPGYPGLNQINVTVPQGITQGEAVPIRLNYLSRPSNEATIAVH